MFVKDEEHVVMRIKSKADYTQHYQKSTENPEAYWGDVAKQFEWYKPWNTVLKGSFDQQIVEWFLSGKTNITQNCLDRHLSDRKEKKRFGMGSKRSEARQKMFHLFPAA